MKFSCVPLLELSGAVAMAIRQRKKLSHPDIDFDARSKRSVKEGSAVPLKTFLLFIEIKSET